jgi:glycerophosphoryl diester phosphodiesterase
MRWLLLWLFALTAFAEPRDFFVQAHRGASAEYLENTLPAFTRAIEVGADSVELDIHVTKDGALIIHHDFELDPAHTRDVDGKPLPRNVAIHSLTLAELQKLDVVDDRRIQVKNPQSMAARRLPTLDQVFTLFKNSKNPHAKKMVIDIEVKSAPNHPEWSPDPATFAQRVVETIRKSGGENPVVVRSFDHRILKEMRKLDPKVALGALTDPSFTDYAGLLREVHPQILAPNFISVTPELVAQAHQMGAKVVPYTVNEKADWDRAMKLGLDGVTTDHPRALLAHLTAKYGRCAGPTAFLAQ